MTPRPIKLKPVPSGAYNEQRPANALLLTHVRELEKAVRAAGQGRRVQTGKPRTEAEVAAYIRHLNRALFQQTLLPGFKRKPLKGRMIVDIARKKEARSSARTTATPKQAVRTTVTKTAKTGAKRKTTRQGRTR